MELPPAYTPSGLAIPPNAYFRAANEKVYLSYPCPLDLEKLAALEAKCNPSGEIEVGVKKSRVRKSWDAIRAKPKNWWLHLRKRERHWWGYLVALLVCGGLCAIVSSMIYVTYDHIPQHISKDWAKYEYTKMDSVSEGGLKLKREPPVLTESAWPTEVTTVGLLATSTASPGTVAVPFTA